ncbi:MAG: MBL fold metallo-hydrolase [Lachnospiraceae bacterium]|nr:MBL fold metallo-hydrolase [Lachnospiraceae bacterium]
MKGFMRLGQLVLCMVMLMTGRRQTDRAYWDVTQYQTIRQKQAMIYTITDQSGRLILIDGGYREDADQIRSIIRDHGDRVYAWILTHPHPDHIGAFNAIMASDDGITVDRIYASNVNGERYHETARPYDDISCYDEFCQIAKELANITYLSENDTFSALGLDFKVLHGWDAHVDGLASHLCNNGSLMFKVSGKSTSMLFCSDTQKEMQKYILPGHRKELEADYVQCGHHGNWGLTEYFYRLVNAKAAFMDAPPYILEDRNGTYDGYQLLDFFESEGMTVFRYDGGTHSVRLT